MASKEVDVNRDDVHLRTIKSLELNDAMTFNMRVALGLRETGN